MHPNKVFHDRDRSEILKMSRDVGFGVLIIVDGSNILTSHAPFIIREDSETVECHLAINNPMKPLLDAGCKVKLCVMGPNAYVSPDWYGIENQVPTWNYVATEFCGFAKAEKAEWLPEHLARLSAHFEGKLLPKTPWEIDKMDEKRFKLMQKAIFGVSMKIETLDGSWKLGQNKQSVVREGVINALSASTQNSNHHQIADRLRQLDS